MPLQDDRRRVALASIVLLGAIALAALALVGARRWLGLEIGEVTEVLLIVVSSIAAVARFYFRTEVGRRSSRRW